LRRAVQEGEIQESLIECLRCAGQQEDSFMIPSHEECLKLLANPSTRNILEKFGYEYSDSGMSEFRKIRPNIVPVLVQAIVIELEHHPVFPPSARSTLPEVGLYIQRRADGFAVMDIDKPSFFEEHVHSTPEGAARSYVFKLIDPYWLQPDRVSTGLPT
jgi:hypothetical protein